MAYDNRPNLSYRRFEQCGCDYLYLGGHNCVCGTGGTISSNSGYEISGCTIFSTGTQLHTLKIGCNVIASGASTAVGAAVHAMGIASVAVGCGACTCGNGSVSIGAESKALSNCSTIIGYCNINCAIGSNILGGHENLICSGSTNTTIVGGIGINLTNNTYANYVVVPNLAILSTPSGSGKYLCRNPINGKIELATGSSGSTSGSTDVCVDSQFNTFSCINPLISLTTGDNNIALGKCALKGNTVGIDNVALGRCALFNNKCGNYNVAIGEFTMFYNTGGTSNVAIGDYAFYSNICGYDNVSIGTSSMSSHLCGRNNVAIGVSALQGNTIGFDNVGIGCSAGNNNVTGCSNIFIGRGAGCLEMNSNRLHIANSSNKSLIYGEFDNEKLCIRGKTYISGLTNTCNSNLIYYNSSTKELTYGVSCYLPLTGGTVSGCITAVNFILSSDERLKENIKPITISEIDKVGLVQFNFICDKIKQLRYGVIAQDLEKIHPEMVYENNGYKEVAYIDFLVAKINSLENRLITLESKLL